MSIDDDREAIAKILGSTMYSTSIKLWDSSTLINLDTIDGIASLWPKGWTWKRYVRESFGWFAMADDNYTDFVFVPDSNNELADRTRLLRLVLESKASP